MKLLLYIKNVYGSEMLYPVENQKRWERITGRKTFTCDCLMALQAVGVEVIINNGVGGTTTIESFFNLNKGN